MKGRPEFLTNGQRIRPGLKMVFCGGRAYNITHSIVFLKLKNVKSWTIFKY